MRWQFVRVASLSREQIGLVPRQVRGWFWLLKLKVLERVTEDRGWILRMARERGCR